MNPSRPGASLVTQRLSTHVVMLVWDDPRGPAHRRVAIEFAGSSARPPISRVALPVEGGNVRTLIALRPDAADPDAADRAIRILGRDDAVLASIDAVRAQAGDGEFDPFHLLDRLEGTGKVRLARFLLELTRTVFRLDADPFYVVNMRHLVDALCPAPGPLVSRASVGDDLVLCETGVSEGIAPLQTAVAVGRRRISRVPFAPLSDDGRGSRRGITPAWLMLRPDTLGADRTIVIFGKGGFAIRRPAVSGSTAPSVIEQRPGSAASAPVARRYVLDCLGHIAGNDASAAALAREIAAFAPEDPSSSGAPPVSLVIGTCVATGAGLFVAGRLCDRHGLVRGIAVRGAGFESELALDRLAGIAGDARRPGGLGFLALAFMPGRTPKPNRFHFQLRLHSGAVVEAHAVAALDTGAAARAAIMAAVPDSAATPSVIDRIVGPALDGIPGDDRDGAAPAEVMAFGTAAGSPRASVIVPFGRERAPLLARAGALCADRESAAIELIHVLDRPAARAGAERSLAGLWQTFGLPGRLICVPPSGDPSGTMAAAASVARGEQLVFLAEWAMPLGTGFLQPLLDGLAAAPEIGLCGARILGADGSLRGAGLELAVNGPGELSLDALYRGLPGDFPEAVAARDVFAVSGAALAIRRDLFERIGGIGAGYATADWRDADLAARVRAAGARVRFVPSATVTDFGDEVGPAGARRDVALRADAWRFARLWSARIAEWTGAAPPDGADPVGSEPGVGGDDASRWAA